MTKISPFAWFNILLGAGMGASGYFFAQWSLAFVGGAVLGAGLTMAAVDARES